jgi:hypothetical protein
MGSGSVRLPICPSAHLPIGPFHIPLEDPGEPEGGETFTDVMALGAAGIVDAEGRLAAGEGDLPHRDANTAAPLDVNLAGIREGFGKAIGRHGRAPFAGMNRIRFQGSLLNPGADVRGDAPGGVEEG